MKKILSDPIWTGIGVIVSIVVGVITIFLTINQKSTTEGTAHNYRQKVLKQDLKDTLKVEPNTAINNYNTSTDNDNPSGSNNSQTSNNVVYQTFDTLLHDKKFNLSNKIAFAFMRTGKFHAIRTKYDGWLGRAHDDTLFHLSISDISAVSIYNFEKILTVHFYHDLPSCDFKYDDELHKHDFLVYLNHLQQSGNNFVIYKHVITDNTLVGIFMITILFPSTIFISQKLEINSEVIDAILALLMLGGIGVIVYAKIFLGS